MAFRTTIRRALITTNGNGNVKAISNEELKKAELAFEPPLVPIGSLLAPLINKAYDFLVYDRHAARPKMLPGKPGELVFEIPAQGLEKHEIKMMITERNRFVLKSLKPSRPYQYSLKLPFAANFEKAKFEMVRLKLGLVEVKITNFEREEVQVKFTEEEGDE